MSDIREALEVPLTRGLVALVSPEDDWVLKHRWVAKRSGSSGNLWYAYRTIYLRRRNVSVAMHRAILRAPSDLYIDHIDNNGLNNTRENIRLCTLAQNNANRSLRPNRSGFRGVQFDPRGGARKPYQAVISVQGKTTSLGTYLSAEDAARAYDRAATERFGEFARLNFPVEATQS